MKIETIVVDYHNPQQAQDLVILLNEYAIDPMGGGEDLSKEVKASLVDKLAKLPYALSIITYVDGKPAGFSNCFICRKTTD